MRRIPFAAVALVVLTVPVVARATIPVVHEPVTAVVKSGATFVPVSVTGWGLGPESGSEVDVVSASGTTTLGTSHADVVLWNDRQIVVKISPSLTEVGVRVRHPGGESMLMPVEYFRYDAYDAAAPASIPGDVAVDAAGRVWLVALFHDALRYWDPSDSTVHTVTVPHATGTGAFNALGVRTWISPIGDDVALDSLGRVWWAQGGGAHATLPAFSRIVSYDPAQSAPNRFKIWNVPGNQSWATHVAWDAVNARLWFAQLPRTLCNTQVGGSLTACTTVQPARLVGFYPDDHGGALPHDNTFDFEAATAAADCVGFVQNSYPTPPTAGTCAGVTPSRACFTDTDCVLAADVCDGTEAETGCFREFPVTDASAIRGVTVDGDGTVWFSNTVPVSGAGYLGALDPTSGTITEFPFRGFDVPSASPAFDAAGPQAVELALGPNGDIVVAEGSAARVSRLNTNIWLYPFACTSLLGPNTSNACLTEFLSPNYCDWVSGVCALGAGSGSGTLDKRVRSVAIDPLGTTWFTQRGRTTGSPSTSLGLVRPGWGRAAMLPPLSLFGGAAFQGGGVNTDPVTGAVWFADTDRRHLSRLRAMPVAFGPATAIRKTGASLVPMSVSGSGFGMPISGSSVVVQSGATTLTIPATDSSVALWSDRQVVVEVAASLTNATMSITTPAGSSTAVNTEYFDYDVFDTRLTGVGAALDPALDPASGRVFVLDEFHQHLDYWDPNTGEAELICDEETLTCEPDPTPATSPDLIPHADGTGAFNVAFPCKEPTPENPNPFCECPENDPDHWCEGPTWNSTWGEDVDVDDQGRAWFGQGGATVSGNPNYSRIVSYDIGAPLGDRFAIWNVPGDDVGPHFLSWDAANGRLWFTTRRRVLCNSGGFFDNKCTTIAPPRLMSFRPDAGLFPPDNTFDFHAAAALPANACVGFVQDSYPNAPTAGTCYGSSVPCATARDCVLRDTICAPSFTDDRYCFRAYDLEDPADASGTDPGLRELAHIEPEDGLFWMATYVKSGKVGRFDPATGDQVWYPARPGESPGRRFALGTAPWEVQVVDGDVVFSEYGAGRLARLDGDQVDAPACQSLVSVHAGTDCAASPDATCDNPCITHMFPPNICTGDCAPWGSEANVTVKSVREAPDGRVWFTETGEGLDIDGQQSVGFLEGSSSARLIMLPPMGLVSDGTAPFWGSGIDIDQSTGEIWFTDLRRSELNRLTP